MVNLRSACTGPACPRLMRRWTQPRECWISLRNCGRSGSSDGCGICWSRDWVSRRSDRSVHLRSAGANGTQPCGEARCSCGGQRRRRVRPGRFRGCMSGIGLSTTKGLSRKSDRIGWKPDACQRRSGVCLERCQGRSESESSRRRDRVAHWALRQPRRGAGARPGQLRKQPW